MEFNENYDVNIISRVKAGSFIIVPKFNQVKTKQYLNYRKELLTFKECSEMNEWFEILDDPLIEIGTVVLVKINNVTNEWARGIISKYKNNDISPEIYLIDTQTFTDKNKRYELRICPSKYKRLKLPTYYICIDLCFNMDDDSLKNAIEMMIYKNQHGELNIVFTPQSKQNNEYIGFLTVNNIPLKKYLHILLKQYSTKKEHQLSIFDPLQLFHLKNIFIPTHLSTLAFLDESLVLSISDLNSLNDSNENMSSNYFTDTIHYSEDISDNSSIKTINSSSNSSIISIAEQIVYSSKSSSMGRSNSSICSLDKEDNLSESSSGSRSTDFTSRSSEKHQVSINPKTIVNNQSVSVNSIDYSEDFSDDSSLKTIDSSKNSSIIPIAEQIVRSSKKSSMSRRNSPRSPLDKEDNLFECSSGRKSTNFTSQSSEKHQVSINPETTVNNQSVSAKSLDYSEDTSDDSSLNTIDCSMSRSNSSRCSLDKENNLSECSSGSRSTDFTSQNSEKHQESINPESTADIKDENKSNVENTSAEIGNQEINKQKPFIHTLMKKRSMALRQKAAECELNKNIIKTSNVSGKPKISCLFDDSNIWWSSDDED